MWKGRPWSLLILLSVRLIPMLPKSWGIPWFIWMNSTYFVESTEPRFISPGGRWKIFFLKIAANIANVN